MKFTIYYNVTNGGDGSAYPSFYESMELADWVEDHEDEGWGESSTGSIVVKSNSPITCSEKMTTKEAFLIDRYFDTYDYDRKEDERNEFMEKFFPDGLPTFTVITEEINDDPEYMYLRNNIFADGEKIASEWQNREKSGKVFEDFLNTGNREEK
jgi:hypothetical protein